MSRMFHTAWHMVALSRLAADQRGVTAVITGLGLTIIVGFAGLAIDVAYWLNVTRTIQAAADQAAYSAASAAKTNGCSSTSARPQAIAIAAARGFPIIGTPTTTGDTMTLTDGTTTLTIKCTTSNSHFTVKVEQRQPMWFAGVFMPEGPMAAASATAKLASAISDLCVLALDGYDGETGGTDASAAQVTGSSGLNLNCGLAVDSTNPSALSTSGDGTLTATNLYIMGNVNGGGPPPGSSSITVPSGHTMINQITGIDDPYLAVTIGALSGCGANGTTGTDVPNSVTLNPGVYCGGLTIGGNSPSNVTLNPGVYYVVGGSGGLTFSSKVNVTGVGVTFVLTGGLVGGTTYPYATLTINAHASVELTAPTTGTFGGIVFFQDRNAPVATGPSTCGGGSSTENKINGGSDQKITGAIYFPNQTICYNGNSSVSGAGKCTQLIARTFDFTGNSDVKLECAGTGIRPMTALVPQLIQ